MCVCVCVLLYLVIAMLVCVCVCVCVCVRVIVPLRALSMFVCVCCFLVCNSRFWQEMLLLCGCVRVNGVYVCACVYFSVFVCVFM
jgi:hypothetical protein